MKGLFYGLLMGLVLSHKAYAEVTLRVHHFLSTSSTTHALLLVPWAASLERASQGAIKMEIYPAMQLGGAPPQLYDQAKRGLADVIWTLPGYTPGRFPTLEAFELPFMAGSAEATSQAAYEYYSLYAQAEFADVKVLAVHVHAPGVLHMKNKPVRRLEDLRGLKIRAPTRITNDMLRELGATPIAMPVPSLPDALAKGLVDGALIPYEVARPLRVHELTDSHTAIRGRRGLYTAVFILAMNKKKYDGLAPELRRIIDDHSHLAFAGRAGRLWDEADGPVIELARRRGNSFHFIEGAERRRWEARGTRVTQKWMTEMNERGLNGEMLVEEAKRLIGKYENQ